MQNRDRRHDAPNELQNSSDDSYLAANPSVAQSHRNRPHAGCDLYRTPPCLYVRIGLRPAFVCRLDLAAVPGIVSFHTLASPSPCNQLITSALPSLFYVACLYMADIYRDMSSRSRSTAISARFIQSFVLEVEGGDCAHIADSVSGSGHKKERVAVREWRARRKLRKKRRARRSALLCHHPSLITRGGNCWASIG